MKKTMNLEWFGKEQAKLEALATTSNTLVEDVKRSVSQEKNKSKNRNMIIEGDNLDVLKILTKNYKEKIQCIYIDPPYNTGKNFTYSDVFKKENSGIGKSSASVRNRNFETASSSHSQWLSMMYSRLLLAQVLLREDGVIFISIDDHEMHHLRMLCNEVFGEKNFICTFIWTQTKGAQGMYRENGLVSNHEYILTYAKTKNKFRFKGVPREAKGFHNPDHDSRGPWKRQYLQRKGQGLPVRQIRDPKTNKIYKFETPYTQKKLNEFVSKNEIIFPEKSSTYPARKEFLFGYKQNKQLVTFLGLYPTKSNTEQLYRLFNGIKIFNNPKPVPLLKYLFKNFEIKDNVDSIFLDFFAGSGSSAQALIELYKEDGLERKFILVQKPEPLSPNNLAYKAGYRTISDITIERSKRVVQKLKLSGFKVYKTTH